MLTPRRSRGVGNVAVGEDEVHEHVARRLFVHPYRESVDHSAKERLQLRVASLEEPGPRKREHPFDLRAARQHHQRVRGTRERAGSPTGTKPSHQATPTTRRASPPTRAPSSTSTTAPRAEGPIAPKAGRSISG
ncbi:MAG: hypothetical protein ACK55Z_32465, partial [bacterium]